MPRQSGSVSAGYVAPPTPSEPMIFTATPVLRSASTSTYYSVNGVNITPTTGYIYFSDNQAVVTRGGTADSLFVTGNTPVITPDEIWTLNVNGSPTPLSVDIATGLSTGYDGTHSVTLFQGDVMSFTRDSGSDFAAAKLSFRFTPF